MDANLDSLERVGGADERINKMLTEYLENKDEEASEVTQTVKRLRDICCGNGISPSTSTAGNRGRYGKRGSGGQCREQQSGRASS